MSLRRNFGPSSNSAAVSNQLNMIYRRDFSKFPEENKEMELLRKVERAGMRREEIAMRKGMDRLNKAYKKLERQTSIQERLVKMQNEETKRRKTTEFSATPDQQFSRRKLLPQHIRPRDGNEADRIVLAPTTAIPRVHHAIHEHVFHANCKKHVGEAWGESNSPSNWKIEQLNKRRRYPLPSNMTSQASPLTLPRAGSIIIHQSLDSVNNSSLPSTPHPNDRGENMTTEQAEDKPTDEVEDVTDESLQELPMSQASPTLQQSIASVGTSHSIGNSGDDNVSKTVLPPMLVQQREASMLRRFSHNDDHTPSQAEFVLSRRRSIQSNMLLNSPPGSMKSFLQSIVQKKSNLAQQAEENRWKKLLANRDAKITQTAASNLRLKIGRSKENKTPKTLKEVLDQQYYRRKDMALRPQAFSAEQAREALNTAYLRLNDSTVKTLKKIAGSDEGRDQATAPSPTRHLSYRPILLQESLNPRYRRNSTFASRIGHPK